jgi:hypothetical protein
VDAGACCPVQCSEFCRGIVGELRENSGNLRAQAKQLKTLSTKVFAVFSTTYEIASEIFTKYFPNANFSDFDRPLFAFAAYNAGAGRIASLRKEAERRGLDPNKWFNNVEIVTAEKVGIETTTYVRNIFKYYVAYTRTKEVREERQKAREAID